MSDVIAPVRRRGGLSLVENHEAPEPPESVVGGGDDAGPEVLALPEELTALPAAPAPAPAAPSTSEVWADMERMEQTTRASSGTSFSLDDVAVRAGAPSGAPVTAFPPADAAPVSVATPAEPAVANGVPGTVEANGTPMATEGQVLAAMTAEHPAVQIDAPLGDSHREALSALIEGVSQVRESNLAERKALAERLQMAQTREQEALALQAARNGQNAQAMGGGGIASGLGALLSAPFRAVGANRDRSAQRELQASIAKAMSKHNLLLGSPLDGMVRSADDVFRQHHAIAGRVQQFNDKFKASPQGERFLRDLQTTADALGDGSADGVRRLRRAMHDSRDARPGVQAMREKARALAASPEFAADMQAISSGQDRYQQAMERFGQRLATTEANGTAIPGAERTAHEMTLLDQPDALLSPPGEKLDAMKEKLKAAAEAIQKAVMAMVSRLGSMFQRSPAP